MAEIFNHTLGATVIVDEEDKLLVLGLDLSFGGDGYIYTRYRGQKTTLQRVLAERAGFNLDHEIDHKNRNKLDNRRENLRPATRTQNCQNTVEHSNSTTGFKGVNYRKDVGKYRARIRINGERVMLGWFKTAEEASRAYDEAAKKHHGEFRA